MLGENNITKQKQIPKENKKVARIEPHRGHKMFQLDLTTLQITEAEFSDVHHELSGKVVKQIIIKEKHLYTSALNKKNAEKHFKNMIARQKGYPV